MLEIKLLVTLSVFIIQVLIFYKIEKSIEKMILFLIFSSYAIKPYLEKYTPFLDVLIIMVSIIGVALLTFRHLRNTMSIKMGNGTYPLFILIFLSLVIINGFINIFKNGQLTPLYVQGLFNILYITFLVIFIFISIKNENDIKIITSSTKISFYMLIIFGFYDRFVNGWIRIGDDINPNYYAQMLVLLFVFYMYSVEKKYSISNLFFCIITVILVNLSDSSSAKISLTLLCVISLFIVLKFKKWTLNLFGYSYILLILYFIYKTINMSIENGILNSFIKEDLSRVYIWSYAWSYIKENLLLGAEYNTFRSPWSNMYFVTHNDYLRIAAELGAISILIFVIYILLQIYKISSLKANNLFFLSSSLFFITITYSITHNNINNLMFWVGIVFPTISYSIDKKREGDEHHEINKKNS